jgi:curved DNA-binding protein CbpA
MGNTYSINELDKINTDEINPYELFKVNKENPDWDTLKKNYKKIALVIHPDKGGNAKLFNWATNQFKKIAKEIQTKQKTHFEMKETFQDNQTTELTYFDSTKPFSEQFNKIFDSYRMYDDDTDHGYGDKMSKSTKSREDIPIVNVFEGKVTNEKFNNKFEQTIPTEKIIKYQEPEPTHYVKSIGYTNIGKKTDDYTSGIDATNLKYTDYMKAYTEERTPTEQTRKQFKNKDEYQSYSDKKMKKILTEKELSRIEQAKLKEETDETFRLKRIHNKDNNNELQFNKFQNDIKYIL